MPGTYFNAVGISQIHMQSVENKELSDIRVYIIQDGYIAANVVPNHEATIVMA